MAEDWIKLYRKIQHSEFWFSERFTKAQAWIDLLIIASYTERTFFVRGNEIKIKNGQFIHSLETLAHRWRWNRRTVENFLKALEKRQMLHRRKSNICTINTIENYKQYQHSTPQSAQQTTPQGIRRVHTNKNVKKVKKVKKRYGQSPVDNARRTRIDRGIESVKDILKRKRLV